MMHDCEDIIFSKLISKTTNEDIKIAFKLKYWNDQDVVLLWGKLIPEPDAHDTETLDQKDNINWAHPLSIGKSTCCMSQSTQQMFQNDAKFGTQSIQSAKEMQQSSVNILVDNNMKK